MLSGLSPTEPANPIFEITSVSLFARSPTFRQPHATKEKDQMRKNSKLNNQKENEQISAVTDGLMKLQEKRRIWEDGLERSSRLELHEILGGCYRLYLSIKDNTKLKAALSARLKENKSNFTAGASLQTKIVRFVFDACSQQYTYANAIKVAADNRVPEKKFKDWLAEHGGPDGIRKAKTSDNRAKLSNDAIAAAQTFYETSDAVATIEAEFDRNDKADNDFVIALIRPSTQPGQNEVAYVTSAHTVVQAVLRYAGGKLSAIERENALDTRTSLETMSCEAFDALTKNVQVQQ